MSKIRRIDWKSLISSVFRRFQRSTKFSPYRWLTILNPIQSKPFWARGILYISVPFVVVMLCKHSFSFGFFGNDKSTNTVTNEWWLASANYLYVMRANFENRTEHPDVRYGQKCTVFRCWNKWYVPSRVQKFPAWNTKAAPSGRCCEGYIVPSVVRLMYQLKSVLK